MVPAIVAAVILVDQTRNGASIDVTADMAFAQSAFVDVALDGIVEQLQQDGVPVDVGADASLQRDLQPG